MMLDQSRTSHVLKYSNLLPAKNLNYFVVQYVVVVIFYRNIYNLVPDYLARPVPLKLLCHLKMLLLRL